MPYTKPLAAAYRDTKIKTASQGQLIVMLYNGAVQQLDTCIELLEIGKKEPGKREKIGKCIIKTQEIVSELMASLDFEQGGEIAQNLFALYRWFNQELLAANLAQEATRLKPVRNMLQDLLGAWTEVASKAPEAADKPTTGLNIAW